MRSLVPSLLMWGRIPDPRAQKRGRDVETKMVPMDFLRWCSTGPSMRPSWGPSMRPSCIALLASDQDLSRPVLTHRAPRHGPTSIDALMCAPHPIQGNSGVGKEHGQTCQLPSPVQIVEIEMSDEQNAHAPDDTTPAPRRRTRVKSFTSQTSEGANESYVSLPWRESRHKAIWTHTTAQLDSACGNGSHHRSPSPHLRHVS